MTKKRLRIDGMHCTSCSLLIEGELGDLGVDATCNFSGGYVDVSFDETRVTPEKIRETIEGLGYRVASGK